MYVIVLSSQVYFFNPLSGSCYLIFCTYHHLFVSVFSFLVPKSLVMFSQIAVLFKNLKYFFAMSFICCTFCVIAI